MVRRIKKMGIHVYALGVGTAQGGPIPLRSREGEGYKKDKEGNTVITRLDQKTLRTFAQATGGLYYTMTESDKDIEVIYDHIRKLKQREFKNIELTRKEEQYQIFLLVALAALCSACLMGERRNLKQ